MPARSRSDAAQKLRPSCFPTKMLRFARALHHLRGGLELYIVDTSTNGVALNQAGARVAPNLPVPVRPNDRLLIGDFVITIAYRGDGRGHCARPRRHRRRSPASRAGATMPGSILPQTRSGVAASVPGGSEAHDFLNSAVSDFLAAPKSDFGAPVNPSDFGFGDPLGQAFARPIMADPLPPPAQFGIPEDWGKHTAAARGGEARKGPAPCRRSSPFHFRPATAPTPVAPPALRSIRSTSRCRPIRSTPSTFRRPVPAAPGEPQFAPLPGEAAAPLSPPPSQQPAAAPQGGGGPVDAAWGAFFEGAGLSADDVRLSPDAMHRLGVLYRQVVLGLWNIIQDRAAFKDEFRVERTQLSMGKNNPIKHLPPLDAAKILLGEPLPGFMSADEAVRTAFEDIKKHQLAMLAGVQQSLSAVFDRLSPAEIEKMIEKAAADKKGMMFWRGIDRWSVYLTIFEALRKMRRPMRME